MTDTNRKYDHIYTWIVYDDTIATKKTDKSFFKHNGTAIPKELQWYFNAEDLNHGEKKSVVIFYNGCRYNAYIIKELYEAGRTRLFWEKQLGENIASLNDSNIYPVVEFRKLCDGYYEWNFYKAEDMIK